MAGAIGNFIEWYDFVLYGASAAILADLFFPSANKTASLMTTFATFGVAFAARPFGAVILGNAGDRAGRRNVLAGVVICMSLCTALIAALPTYASIGFAAPLLLLALRALQGFTAGGEFGGSATFIVEYAPQRRRGLYGAWQTATVGFGSATAVLMVILITTLLSDDAVHAWGWRIPFALGLPLGLYPAFKLDQIGTLPAIILGQSLFGLIVTPIIVLVPSVLSELFPTTVRFSALSIAYTARQRRLRRHRTARGHLAQRPHGERHQRDPLLHGGRGRVPDRRAVHPRDPRRGVRAAPGRASRVARRALARRRDR